MKSKLYKSIILLALLFAINVNADAQAPNWAWAESIGAASYDGGLSITSDANGNVYTTGLFVGTVDFDPGAGVYNLTAPHPGYADIFVFKLDPSGKFIWAKQFGGNNDEQGNYITSDSKSNIYITGIFRDTADFDPGPGVFNLISAGDNDIFIAKLDSSGNLIWAKRMGGTGADVGLSMDIDQTGNVYTTGFFSGTADFDPDTSAIFNLTSAGIYDMFISKLDSSGNFIWAKGMGGTDYDYSFSISHDAFGSIYTSGSFHGTSDFDPGPGVFNLTSSGNADIFVSKFDTSGNLVWAKRIGASGTDYSTSMAIDDSGNVFTTGIFTSTVDFDPGASIFNLSAVCCVYDMFILKLDSSGNFIWAKRIGGSSYDFGAFITLDTYGNVYTTGHFNGAVDFDPGSGIYNLTSFGSDDIFVSKLDNLGNFVWAKQIGGGGSDFGIALNIDASDNVHLMGYFYSPNMTVGSTTLINSDNTGATNDIIIATLSCSSFATISPIICNSYTSPSGKYVWTISGSYIDTIPNYNGCDSLITINLIIGTANTTSMLTISACNNYISPSGNYNWISSGVYIDTIPNSGGCDSIITINLTVGTSSTTASQTVTSCDSYISPSGNYTWTNSGIFLDTIPNSGGCDSIITTNLSINNSTTSSLVASNCYSYISPSGNYVWTNSGTYLDTIANSVGCDSVITIMLTIINNTTSTLAFASCFNYISPSGNYIWNASGVYSDTIPNAFGCDSIITINLTINTVDTIVTQNANLLTANASVATYQWLDCNNNYSPINGATNQVFAPSVVGSYAVAVTQNNCTDTSLCYLVTGVGLTEINDENNFEVFPNPANDQFTIVLKNIYKSNYITIQDITGQIVLRSKSNGIKKFDVNTKDFVEGVYLVKVQTNDFVGTQKIIISK